MTKNLLVELGLEELPAYVVTPSEKQLGEKMAAFLDDNRLSYESNNAVSHLHRTAPMHSPSSTNYMLSDDSLEHRCHTDNNRLIQTLHLNCLNVLLCTQIKSVVCFLFVSYLFRVYLEGI